MINAETKLVLDTVYDGFVAQWESSRDGFTGGEAMSVAHDYFMDESPKYDYLLDMLDNIDWDWIAEKIIDTHKS